MAKKKNAKGNFTTADGNVTSGQPKEPMAGNANEPGPSTSRGRKPSSRNAAVPNMPNQTHRVAGTRHAIPKAPPNGRPLI